VVSDYRHLPVPARYIDTYEFKARTGACVCPARKLKPAPWLARVQGMQGVNHELYCPECDAEWISVARGITSRLSRENLYPNSRSHQAAVIRSRLERGRLTPEQAEALLLMWCHETPEGRRLGWYVQHEGADEYGENGQWVHHRDEPDGQMTLTEDAPPPGQRYSGRWTLTLIREGTRAEHRLNGWKDAVRVEADRLWSEAGGGPLPVISFR